MVSANVVRRFGVNVNTGFLASISQQGGRTDSLHRRTSKSCCRWLMACISRTHGRTMVLAWRGANLRRRATVDRTRQGRTRRLHRRSRTGAANQALACAGASDSCRNLAHSLLRSCVRDIDLEYRRELIDANPDLRRNEEGRYITNDEAIRRLLRLVHVRVQTKLEVAANDLSFASVVRLADGHDPG